MRRAKYSCLRCEYTRDIFVIVLFAYVRAAQQLKVTKKLRTPELRRGGKGGGGMDGRRGRGVSLACTDGCDGASGSMQQKQGNGARTSFFLVEYKWRTTPTPPFPSYLSGFPAAWYIHVQTVEIKRDRVIYLVWLRLRFGWAGESVWTRRREGAKARRYRRYIEDISKGGHTYIL